MESADRFLSEVETCISNLDADDQAGRERLVAVLSNVVSRCEGYRLRLLRSMGGTDRAVLSATLGISRGEAAQLQRTVERLTGFDEVQTAVETGVITASAARMLAEAMTPERRDAGMRDEHRLVELARQQSPHVLAMSLNRWARNVDEENGEDTDGRLRDLRSLETRTRSNGMTELIARLDPESADIITTALDARVKEDWRAEPASEHDQRTTTQRRLDALTGICNDFLNRTTLAGSDTTPSARPHVNVIVDIQTLLSGAGTAVTETGAILSAETARRICCDAGIARIVTNGPSAILDVGREQRVFRGALRRALVLRDRRCRWPSCNAAPAHCDGHHIDHWVQNGPTRLDNGLLLCKRHHHYPHEGGWTITGNPNHTLTFTSPTGLTLTSPTPHTATDNPAGHPPLPLAA